MNALHTTLFILAAAGSSMTNAQADGMVAYVPRTPIARTADDTRVSFVESAVPGQMEAVLPLDANRVDILNSRGNIHRTYGSTEIEHLELNKLRAGTWTLRVHTSEGLLVRRFAILNRGTIVWNLPERKHKRGRKQTRQRQLGAEDQ
ncbi:MAG: hypothetical protein KA408_11750 [Flavobacteriales bacterium]|nr:hypothetical protein [Flavobacteriales bacterium]